MDKVLLLILFIIPFSLFSLSTFIVTDVKTDRVLYMENDSYANRELFPGSLLKPFAILSVKNDQDKFYNCTGWSQIDKRCWLRESHNKINLIEALAYSCNSYFIQYLTNRLFLPDLYKTLNYYITFSGNLSESNYIEESIGLGTSIRVTPLNMLFAYNRLFRENPTDFFIIRQGMKECIYYGTGELFSSITGELDVACKTGTSYNIKSDGSYNWKKNTGWFIIMYPADDPKYSFLLVVDITEDKLAVKEASKKFLRWIDEN